MTRSVRSAWALVLALGIAPRPVLACCDDFWSCAGAVATGGLTCVVEAALNALRGLIRRVESERNATRTEYLARLQATTDEMKTDLARLEQEIKTAMQEIDKARSEAEKLVKEDADKIRTVLTELKLRATSAAGGTVKTSSTAITGTVSRDKSLRAAIASAPPTPTRPSTAASSLARSVSAAEISSLTALASDDSLATLRHRIELLKKRKEAVVAAIVKAEAEMLGLQAKAAEAARSALQDDVIKPLDDLLASLNATLRNPLNAPAAVSSAIAFLDGALSGFHVRTEPLAEEAARAAERAVARKVPPTQEMKKIADDAKKTLETLRKAASLRIAFDRRAFVRGLGALPASSPSAISQAVRLKASFALQESSKRISSRIVALKPEFQRLSQVRRTVDVSPFRQRLAGDFDGFFRGKSPADGKKKRDELLLEARRRFASDPKTLAAVEKLLNDEARVRGVP